MPLISTEQLETIYRDARAEARQRVEDLGDRTHPAIVGPVASEAFARYVIEQLRDLDPDSRDQLICYLDGRLAFGAPADYPVRDDLLRVPDIPEVPIRPGLVDARDLATVIERSPWWQLHQDDDSDLAAVIRYWAPRGPQALRAYDPDRLDGFLSAVTSTLSAPAWRGDWMLRTFRVALIGELQRRVLEDGWQR